MHTTIRRGHIVLVTIGLAIAAIFSLAPLAGAQENEEHAGTTASVDISCIQSAVETREDALLSSWDEFNDTIHAALETRKDALSDAWGLEEKKAKTKATIAAWKTWKKTSKEAHAVLKKERKAAWDTFKKTSKGTCKITVPKEEALEKDTEGTIGL